MTRVEADTVGTQTESESPHFIEKTPGQTVRATLEQLFRALGAGGQLEKWRPQRVIGDRLVDVDVTDDVANYESILLLEK